MSFRRAEFLLALSLMLVVALAVSPSPAVAADEAEASQSEGDSKKKSKKKDDKDDGDPEPSITFGAVEIGGEQVAYTATAGKLFRKTDNGDKKAEIFYVSYTRGGKGDDGKPIVDASRPVTFCFNGGPGSCSVWLHLGMVGPRRVVLPDDASHPAPPYSVVDNPHSLLDVTDIVMIDPVSTGYSRPAEGEKKSQFHGLEADLESVGRFIHDYTTSYNRWSSPKFVLGESYGGIRGAGLARTLQSRYRMYLNGIIFVSGVLDYSTLHFASNNDLPYVLFLPQYAATAWRHKALDDDLLAMSLEEVVSLAEEFAYDEYADALLRGASLPADQRDEVIAEMSRLTGLSAEYLDRAELRVAMWEFSKELLRDRNLVIGRYDSRYALPDDDRNGATMNADPSGAAITGIFSGAMNAYLREELKYEDDRVYEIFGSVRPWSYDPYENRYVTTADRLRGAMTQNPYLKVFAACGHYDLATPAFAMKHTRDHTLLRSDLRSRFSMGYYEAGHMMYIHEPSLVKLRKDLLKFYAEATP